ncbi:MAG: TolC family protein [Myxococcales bacterium]|nr:TolC family protein [Myxococcales bacterium]
MRIRLWTAAGVLAVALSPRAGVAEEPTCEQVDRRTVVPCVLARSPELREELALQRAGRGRREAARPFLPSNPVLKGAVASRASPSDGDFNWYLSLDQELEIGGQSWLRVGVANAELRAQGQRVAAARNSVASLAWLAWFGALAAHERSKLSVRLEGATGAVAATVRAMAANGLASEVDAEIAEAAALRAAQRRLFLEGLAFGAQARLRLLAGGAPALAAGVLEPLSQVLVEAPPRQRPELIALEEVRGAVHRRAELLARERVPNLTLSVMAQRDGFGERVLGGGLSLPIPLPQPVGRTLAGELAEVAALEEKVAAETERVRRDLELELVSAKAEYGAAARARGLYPPERVARAIARLEAIGEQVKAGRLAVRDAILAQQVLVEQLEAEIDAREALCVASVRVVRAAGLPLEGGEP